MKSRLNINKGLDIKVLCCTTDTVFLSHLDASLTTMVKGVRLHIYITIVFTTIVHLPPAICNNQNLKIFAINQNGHGTYSFQFETYDGSFRREEGGIISTEGSAWIVRGEYGYIDSNGKPYYIKYVADKNGYQPEVNNDYTRFNDRKLI